MFEVDNTEYEVEGNFILRDYWKEEIKNTLIEDFYIKSIPPIDDYSIKEWEKYFYNETHYKKFLQDYSFNLFVDCEVPNSKDVEIINIIQDSLFDVVLVDEFIIQRKKANTLFFLSKIRINPFSIIFIDDINKIKAEDYIGIWNPKKNPEQINGPEFNEFFSWCKELELKFKNERPE
ncbi:MAG: hypothetical protein ABIP51_17165 [Bacteroidia bacterium]